MRNNLPIYWCQGQFLTPQHLQQQDLYHQEGLQDLWQRSAPHGWGIRVLRIRDEALLAQLFEVLQCRVITRDGLALEAGSEAAHPNARLASRSFEGRLDPAGGPLGVYLGLPRYRPRETNVAVETKAGTIPLRYHLRRRECHDFYDAAAPAVEIDLLDHELVLLFDRDPDFPAQREAYELIKLAELIPQPTGTGVRCSHEYVPPCLTIDSSLVLNRLLKGMRDLLTARGQEFSAIKRQRGLRATASTIQDILRLVILQTLNRYIPLFHHHLEGGQLHPEAAYGLLRQLVGELSIFSEEVTALGENSAKEGAGSRLPPYDHENIWLCFDLAIRLIGDLVTALTSGPETGIRLIFDGEYYHALLPQNFFVGERSRFYLMIDSAMKGADLWAMLQKVGKICSREDMPRLRQSALFGLKIDYLPVPPEELPQRSSRYTYFGIDTQSPHWKRIRQVGNIAVLGPLDSKDTVMKLLVVRED
ncbi:MAG: type VI secretion system baseplate subunit TssK [Pseudomonadota bacterium]